jgi:hypothetical protein
MEDDLVYIENQIKNEKDIKEIKERRQSFLIKDKKLSQKVYKIFYKKSKFFRYIEKEANLDRSLRNAIIGLKSNIRKIKNSNTFIYMDSGENKHEKILKDKWYNMMLDDTYDIMLDDPDIMNKFVYELRSNNSFYVILIDENFTVQNFNTILKYTENINFQEEEQSNEDKHFLKNVCLFRDMFIGGVIIESIKGKTFRQNVYICDNVHMNIKKVYNVHDKVLKAIKIPYVERIFTFSKLFSKEELDDFTKNNNVSYNLVTSYILLRKKIFFTKMFIKEDFI